MSESRGVLDDNKGRRAAAAPSRAPQPVEAAEFDAVAEDYDALHQENVRASGYPTSYFAEYKAKELAGRLLGRGRAKGALKLLNFGCGIGNGEGFLRQHLPMATIYGVDVSQKSIARARERHRELAGVHFSAFDGRTLPWDFPFDAILVANVLHHVPRSGHAELLRTLHTALAPGGELFLFEHNPWNPVTVRAVETCAFDRDAVLLPPTYAGKILAAAGFRRRTLRFTLFFPKPLAALTPLERFLRKVPLGAQYYYIAAK